MQSGKIGANTAWGKYGIKDALVSVYSPSNQLELTNKTMTFIAGHVGYNLYYDWTASGIQPGTYTLQVLIEDAHSKSTFNNPRCCGWVDFKTTFTVS